MQLISFSQIFFMLRNSLVAFFQDVNLSENSAVGGFMLQMQNIVDNSITFNEV